MNKESIVFIRHILDSIKNIESFINGVTETDFMKNGTTNVNDWTGTNAVPTSWTSTCIAASQCGFGYSNRKFYK